MNAKIRIPAILASLLGIILVLSLPDVAYAQANMAAVQASIDTCNQNVVNNAQAMAQKRVTIANVTYSGMAQIDAAAYQCLDNIEKALDAVDNGGLTFTSLEGILAFAAKQVAWGIAMQLIQQTCQTVLQDIKSIEGFALSQFNHLCVPLPKLNIGGIGAIHLQNAACNGTNLLNPRLNPTIPPVQQPGTWDLWGLLHKN